MFRTHTHQNKPLRHKVVAGALATVVACSPVMPLARLVSDIVRGAHLQTNGQVDANFMAPVVHVDQGYARLVTTEIGIVTDHHEQATLAAAVFESSLFDTTGMQPQFVEPPEPVSYWQMNA